MAKTNKYALVTGGSRGIGREICLKLGGCGYHVLVNYKSNAAEAEKTLSGIRDDVLMMWMEPQQWHSVIGTSLDGFYNVTRPLLKGMLVNRFGRIVNIVSLSGIKGLPGQANYAAAKGGVIAATKALAQEVAKKGVTVNAIAPGFVRTDMTADIDEAELRKQIPAGRFCEPAEVADLAMFLISEQASYITGEVISINGGLYT